MSDRLMDLGRCGETDRGGPQMSVTERASWLDDHRLEIDGYRFQVTAVPFGESDDLLVVKPPDLVRRYLGLIDDEQPRRIVELGVKEGGSTALLALAAQPELLLAADLSPTAPEALLRFAERWGANTLFTAFGLDQADGVALAAFVDSHLSGEGIDLVVDDASHLVGPTTASFEVLFPRLRSGGLYVIEDWTLEWTIASHLRLVASHLDITDRIPVVTAILETLNAPDRQLPDELVASMAAVRARKGPAAFEGRTLFEMMIEVAAEADTSSFDGGDLTRRRPMSDLAVMLTTLAAGWPDVVASVTADSHWVTVRRGPADLDPARFRLTDLWDDHFGYLC